MLNKKILKLILNVNHTIIDDVVYFEDVDSIVFYVHPTKGEQCKCGICGKKAIYYDAGHGTKENPEKRLWRSIDLGTHKAYICADTYRVKCKKHGIVTCAFPWARHNSRFTIDFENTITWLSLNCSKKAISQFTRVSWNTVGPVINRVKDELDINPEHRFDNLKCIGIDETSYRKGHKYMTVIVNHDTGSVIWVSPGFGSDVLSSFFELLSEEQRASIELVAADGAKWIKSCIEKYCPNVTRCIDPFHVVEWINEALNKVRIEAWNDARKKTEDNPKPKRKPGRPKAGDEKKPDEASEIKHTKYALGKNPENLTVKQRATLDLIAKTDNRLWRAYKLKETLRTVFQLPYDEAKEALDKWIKWAQHCRIPAFVELQKKIRRHYDAILATLKYHISNAQTEAINNKIKLAIRMAYGFRNLENMVSMVMLKCSDIVVPLPWAW